ncbi:condensation domain-containing protein [Saccharothrix syringae]|uniref:Non-ribosomal peptide synthetase/polyketide synthase n=1 Tax=Saccharothrix syringae TaxID=103733 RepID=A0A5Q0H4L1_SACSY|nr:condensation domain-containing protein [Saccharothrix syringae]QFZ21171.1 non-ribosomal peptide synthetase/polyketide synthase [Saccharothrix syringae]
MSSSSYVGGVSGGPTRDYSDHFVLPAAPAQRQLWFLCQLDPASNAAYNVVSAVRLAGRLDHLALQRALNEVVARHESLRTGIGLVDGEPRQVVVPEALVSLPVVEGDVQDHAREQAAIPFTLDEPPLLRVVLVREAADRHVLVAVIHHTACDGWSTEVFYRDLAHSYRRLVDGVGDPRPELSIQYADYVAWQADALTGEPMRELVAHWRAALSGVAPLDLPVDRPRGTARRMAGGRLEAPLDAALVSRVDALAADCSATRFMVLLAAFKVALARVTGQGDVAVGTPVAGRHHPDAEELIGFFANTLVLRTRLPLEQPFDAAVAAVRHTCLEAFAHQRMPFDRLVEEMRLPRVLDRNPLFDVMFSVQDAPAVAAELPGLTMTPVELTSTSAKFELWLTVVPHGAGVALRLDYDRDLYDRDTAEALLEVYRRVLTEVVDDPAAVSATLPAADPAERALVGSWATGPALPVPGGTVLDHVGDAVVREGGVEHSGAELRARAAWLAELLREEGVGAGVVVTTPPVASASLVVVALAAFEVGAQLAYGDRHPRDGAFAKDSGGNWVVTTGPRFDPVEPREPAPEDPAWGGFSHRALLAAVTALADRLAVGPDDDVALLGDAPDPVDVLLGLVHARRLVLGGAGDVVVAAPPTWRKLLTEGWTPPAGARLVCRGQVVADDLVAALRRTGNPVVVGRDTPTSAVPVALGDTSAPLANTTRRLLDPAGAPVPVGTVGELHLSGPATHPGGTGERYRHTRRGELAFVGYADDRLVAGDHLVAPGRVETVLAGVPGVRSAAVVAAEVGGDTRLVGWLVLDGARAAANPREQDEFAAGVRARALTTLAAHEVPAAFGVLPELPRLADGGVDRAALTALAALRGQSLLGALDATPPRNRVERAVVAIFKDTLPVQEFGVHADFFALGGHSMLAARVIGRVRDQLGVLVPVRDFFRKPTAAGLAEAVAALEEERSRGQADKATALRGQLAGMTDKEVEQLLRQLG